MDMWLFWLVIGGMLAIGRLIRVGVYLGCFAWAAIITAVLSVIVLDTDQQLQYFLMMSLVAMFASMFFRGKTSSASRRGFHLQ